MAQLKKSRTQNEIKGVKEAIDRLHAVRMEKKLLEKEDKELSDSLKSWLSKKNLDYYEGDVATVKLSQQERLIISPEDLYDSLDQDLDKFFSCISVRLDENKSNGQAGARTYLGTEDIREIATGVPSVSLLVKRKPKDQIKKR